MKKIITMGLMAAFLLSLTGIAFAADKFNNVELKNGKDVTLQGYVVKTGDKFYLYEKENKKGKKLLLNFDALTIEDIVTNPDDLKKLTAEQREQFNKTGKAQYVEMAKKMFGTIQPNEKSTVDARVINSNSIFPKSTKSSSQDSAQTKFNGVDLTIGKNVTLKGYKVIDGDNVYLYEKPNKQGKKLLFNFDAITLEDVMNAHNITKTPSAEDRKKFEEKGKAQYVQMGKAQSKMGGTTNKRGIVEARVIDANTIFPTTQKFDSSKDL